MSDTIQSAPATSTPAAAPVATPAAPAAPPVSPLRAALSQLSQNATWADAGPAIQAATAATAPVAPTSAAPAEPASDPGGQTRDAQGRFAPTEPDTDAAPQDGAVAVSGTEEGEAEGEEAAASGDEATPEGEGEEAPEAITVTLTGRNGEEIPFTVDNEADADVLRALKNDGLRGQEFKRKSGDLEKGFGELRDIGARLKADPEGFMIGELVPERQVSVARALLLNNWDTLAPEIEQFWNDDVARRQAMLDIREQSSAKATDVNNLIAGYRSAAEAERTIVGLIPETVSEEDGNAFFADATAYLTGLAQQGRAIAPTEIPTALARLVAAYGFTSGPKAGEAPAAPVASTTAAATPTVPASTGSDPLAERKEKVGATVRRMTQVAKQRTAAARVAPQGAGAAPVEAPRPPKGADISTTTKFLKERIKPGMGWSDFFGSTRRQA